MRYTREELTRFNSKWDRDNGCKLWNGALDKDGYGTFFFRRKNRRAHRVAYYIVNGDIPKGMVIDHKCKNRHCVKASHLRVVTIKENSLINSEGVGAKNAQKTHCKNGHPFDRKYGKQRYCSICQANKTKRLRKKWAMEDTVQC